VDLTWTPTRAFESSSSGTGRVRFGSLVYPHAGTWRFSSARVEGRLGGLDLGSVDPVWGYLGASRGAETSMERPDR
jgi:hypothetical protein